MRVLLIFSILCSWSGLTLAWVSNGGHRFSAQRPSTTTTQMRQPTPVGFNHDPSPLMMAAEDNEGETTGKRSIYYRAWRVASYPVRRVGRLVFRRKKNADDVEGDDDDDTEIQEMIDTTVSTITENLATALETVESTVEAATADASAVISENLATALETVESVTSEASTVATAAASTASSTLAALTDRSPTAAKGVDLSGDWNLIVTDEFKEAYDKYLTLLGQPYFVRSVAMSIVSLTTETTIQSDNGANLMIRGQNLRGLWERTLKTVAAIQNDEEAIIETADGERVKCEAWWENRGQLHRSWLRGVEKYGGGSFESKRYLEGNDILVCESIFHPDDQSREKAAVTWRFERQAKS